MTSNHRNHVYVKVCLAFCSVLTAPIFAQSDDYILGRRIGHFIGMNVLADMFKVSACHDAIKDGNPDYLRRDHFRESVNFVRARYKNKPEVLRHVIDDAKLARMRDELVQQATPTIEKSVGKNPTSQLCGFLNAEIDNRILLAQSSLP